MASVYARNVTLAVLVLSVFGDLCAAQCMNVNRDCRNHSQISSDPLKLIVKDDCVVMDNGIVALTLSNPEGQVINLSSYGVDNITQNGYWDLNWSENSSSPLKSDKIVGTRFQVMVQTEEQIEVSFVREWSPAVADTSQAPINIDKRYVMLKGASGFYVYGIYERPPGFPACDLIKTRIVFRLNEDKFRHMVIGKNKSRLMPTAEDREPPRGLTLDYKEAVLLVNPTDPTLKGEVDDKYQYSSDNKDGKLYGWYTLESKVGFWIIFPSNEFRNGGPTKQSLRAHTGPISLVIWQSGHYMTDAFCKFAAGETWRKVFGPVFVYLNHVENHTDPRFLWEDASTQSLVEEQNWPYDFPNSSYFLKKEERSSLSGRLLVYDRVLSAQPFPVDSAYVGLAAPGQKGTWQNESKGYQFWTKTDACGYFEIPNIHPGNYNIYGWAPNIIGDYMNETTLTLTAGTTLHVEDLIYEPARNGTTIWEIGIPDRSAAEFFIPDPSPKYINRLFLNDMQNRFRQYGLWKRYAEIYSQNDLIFTVEDSNYSNDWFFAHVTRRTLNGTYVPTTWQIRFQLENFTTDCGCYSLHIAIAASQNAVLEVRFNDIDANAPHFNVSVGGKDNAIGRHGIHGTYQFISLDVKPDLLRPGNNTLFLTQSLATSAFHGILYDYIRMEYRPKFHD